MARDREAFKRELDREIEEERKELGENGIRDLLERGKAWNLAPVLRDGGAVIFPHAGLKNCGHHIAATVHAALDSGADRVLALGVLHALTDELEEERVRVANGADVTQEKHWGIQGPGLDGHRDWEYEFSLLDFLFLWEQEIKRRDIKGPELIVRYPWLAGGKPEILLGIEELKETVRDAVVVATMDAFHHGIGYGDPADRALVPEQGGLDLARATVNEGLAILREGDYWGYNQHCVRAKSDGRDVGQVLRYLLGPLDGRILDLTYADTTEMYNSPPPTWVAAALIEMRRMDTHRKERKGRGGKLGLENAPIA